LRLLETAVDHLKDIVFITEAESIDALGRRVVLVNQAFSRVTGFEPSEVLGKTANVTVGEATDRAALARIEQRLKKRLPVREELQKFGKDGKGYWVELDIIPVFDDDGRHTHWVSVQRDITERKQLHDELAGAERLARRLAGEVEDPLAATMDNLEVIAQQLLAPTAGPGDQAGVAAQLSMVRQGLERARLSAQRARGILRQLAVLAEGSGERRTEVDLRLLVNGVFDDVAQEIPIHGDVLRSYEPLPPVLAYRDQLSQLLYGLVLEAALALDPRYTSTNALFLRIRAAGEHVLVEVEATGPGAAAPQRSNPGTPGAELGLLVARSLTRSIGAELYHHPSPGTGTRYRVRLATSARSPAKHESSERISPRFQSANVLVVEPDARHALELRRLLAAVNHVVVETGFQGAAHRLRSDPQVDVIFCDLSVLGSSARELYQLAGDLSPKLPGTFVFTRSGELPGRLAAFLDVSGRPQVEKPFDVDEVRSALSAVLYADLRSGGG
jgi:PAS domain S-box-containing protein